MTTPELTQDEIDQAVNDLRRQKEIAFRTMEYRKTITTDPEPIQIEPERIWNWLKETGIRIDSENEQVVRKLVNYLSTTAEIDRSKGLLIFGPVGVGKTILMNRAKAFSQHIRERPNMEVIRCDQLVQAYNAKGEEALIGIDQNCICFDDLGSETLGRHYGHEENIMQRIIEMRYRSLPHHMTHFTTNLSAQQLEDFYGVRTRDRLREMTHTLAFDANAKSRRI